MDRVFEQGGEKTGTSKTLILKIRKKQLRFLKYIMRKDSLEKLILTGCIAPCA